MKTLKVLTKALKISGVILVGIVLLTALAFFLEPYLYGEGEYSHDSYPTYSAAAASNAIGGDSVIPPFLPPSATEIRYVRYHDLDISRLWLFFNFDPGDISEIHKRCKRVTEGKVRYWGGRPPGDFIRWPKEITGTVRTEDMQGYEFYWCGGESTLWMKGGILSVDITNGRAYYSKDATFSGG